MAGNQGIKKLHKIFLPDDQNSKLSLAKRPSVFLTGLHRLEYFYTKQKRYILTHQFFKEEFH
jgi:hypothetical protein